MNTVKIYFGNKPLILKDAMNSADVKTSAQMFVHPGKKVLDKIIDDIRKQPNIETIITSADFKGLKKAVFEKFKIIKAGGGIVMNRKNNVLMIFRKGMWDLPKGKLDDDESLEECAVREVEEETGLHNLQPERFFATTWHSYNEKKRSILKESHWYIMNYYGNETPVPQQEEDISEVKWVPLTDLNMFYDEMYPAIAELLKSVVTNLKK